MNNSELTFHFFLQLVLILVACHFGGKLFRRLGQPQVIAEVFVGIVLGPSIFGLTLPDLHNQVFPQQSLSILYTVSQLGLVLYMFIVGTELEVKFLRQRYHSALMVSLAGILAPFCLGLLLAIYLITQPNLVSPGIPTLSAFLFIGAALSITAFPVLARIIEEKGLSNSSLGALAITAASIDDVAAWSMLAVTLASLSGNIAVMLLAIGGGLTYVGVVYLFVRPIFRRLGKTVERTQKISREVLVVTLIMLIIGAWFTESIGIHAVFGAFILGIALPRGKYTAELRRVIELLTSNLLVPLFFVYSGLNTRLNLIDQPYLWLLAGVVILIASLGKGGAVWLAARLAGENNREALGIGVLMNTRGLVELIILNIGLEQHIITPTLFTIMVLMAIVTTVATSPIFSLIFRNKPVRNSTSENSLGAQVVQPVKQS